MADETFRQADNDVRPVVRTSGSNNLGAWAFAAILLIGGFWLFSVLSANRIGSGAPRTTAPETYGAGRISSPPPIALPDRFLEPATNPVEARESRVPQTVQITTAPAPAHVPVTRIVERSPDTSARVELPPREIEPQRPVFDRSLPQGPSSETEPEDSVDRVRAGRLANPSLTVPLGTVIPAVLETALDSTRPGGVRALVQSDVHSFDGTHVLIQRGTRLYGEYDSKLERGQNRALIRWTRLLRPDGVTVALDSPASDPLGRAGVKGKVDGKFFQRFGTAILQSVLDIGVGVATRKATDGVVVALPGSTQNLAGMQPQEIQPTLRVRHGTSVSVYVARDLDFSSVDG